MSKFNFRNDAPEVFRHPNNIQYGKGRIMWGNAAIPEIGDYKGVSLAEGWVLPGGRRTTDFEEAYAWAVMLDKHYVRNTRKMMYD